ncbi:protein FAM184B isoform X1 [Polypterus senegalus]|uniref:protein FAM184B isoform X1 n=1 Tax=Polypterus senegalus TaxID=55291 RepID=UPI0019658F84|nr:protein FAM184B isoform X1 [Polypterus senegalus]
MASRCGKTSQSGGTCNGTSAEYPGIEQDLYDYQMHMKMCKKVAQLTKVIYVLNTKCDEHESNLQTLREAHQEEIQRIVEETREKILQYKNRVGEEMDLRQQLQAMEDSLEQHEKLKEEALSDFEMYRKQTEERELRTETEQAERIMALSKEMLDMKKEFEDRLQSFAELQDKLNQEKAQMMAELEKASQESISLQDECQMLRRSNVDEKGKLEEICNTKTHALREEVEELRTEKHKMEESFEHQICTMKATHEEEYEALRRTLQQTMADTLKLWQQRELEQRKALQTSLQQKLKKAEAELEVKCQKLNDCKKHSLKLQDRIQDLGAEAEESRRKILDAVANQRKAEEELSVAKERLILQESEILKKSEELLFHSKASAEVDDLRSQISQLQRRVKELDQKNNEKSNDHAQHIRQQIHGEELHKAKQLPDEEKARLKEQLIKGLEEVTKKHAAELKSVQNTMEAEKRKIQKDLQAQFEEFKKKMEEERKQIEKEKDDLTCQLKESLIKVSHLESSIQRQHNNPDTVLIETQAVKPNRKLEEEVEQARCLILDLKKELALGKRQHQTAMLAWEAEKERIKERISVLTEAKCKEKIRSSNFAECAEKNESQEQYLACLLLQKDKGAEISEGHKGKLEEMYLQPGGLPLDSKQLLLYKALKKLESKLFKEKELLQQELQDSIQLNHNLKTQLETLNQQMQKQTENNKAHAFKEMMEHIYREREEKLLAEIQSYQTALQAAEERAKAEIQAERQHMEKQQNVLLENQKAELTQQHAGWCRQLAQRHMKQIEDLQLEIANLRNQKTQQQDINLQDQMKSLHSQLEGCQNEVLTLRKENENLKVQLDSVYSELELRRQQTLQLHISEEQQRRSLEDRHHVILESLKQEHRKEIQSIVTDFSTHQTRLQAKIVSLETEIKEKEEKLKRSESRLGDLQVIGKLQDKLNEREQVLKMLVEDLRFQQHSSLNSESSNVRGYETRSRAGSLTPTLKKKKMEEIPPRVISVPNLRCYEKSFKTCEPQSGKQSPHTERSMFPDHRNSMVVPISPQAYMPEPQPPAGKFAEGANMESEGDVQDPQRQEWFTKYFSF